MDEIFNNKSIENATVFQFGYIAEPQQFEVRQIRFHIVSPKGQREFEAATFVKRGKRKEETVHVNQLVVIQGWGHPKLDLHTTHTIQRSGHTTYRKAKFHAFSNKWDDLLDHHLASLAPRIQLIVDGRKRPQLTRTPERGSQSANSSTPSSSTPEMDRRTKAKVHRNEALRLKEKWGVEAVQVRYRETGNWYATLKRFPAALFDRHGYILFPTEEAYQTSPYIHIGKEIGVPKGISAIPGYRPFPISEQAEKIIENLLYPDAPAPSANDVPDGLPARVKSLVHRFIRDTKTSRQVKELYEYRCQVCGERLEILPGVFYAEAHHLQPLGGEHKGPDVKDNILCVCPNHHALFDYFAISLDPAKLLLNKHDLRKSFVDYHNGHFRNIC